VIWDRKFIVLFTKFYVINEVHAFDDYEFTKYRFHQNEKLIEHLRRVHSLMTFNI